MQKSEISCGRNAARRTHRSSLAWKLGVDSCKHSNLSKGNIRQHVKATRHARRTWLIVDLNQLLRPESDEMNITAIKTRRITSSAIEKRTGQSVPKGPKKFPHEPQNTVLQHQARRPSTVQKTGPVSLRVVAHQAPGCLWCDIAFRN